MQILFGPRPRMDLKWILNTTLDNVTFWPARPPPLLFFEGFPNLNIAYNIVLNIVAR